MDCIRPDLIEREYGPASNLAFNEKIKKMMNEGQTVYHFGFGQSPFPVIELATEALKRHAAECAYLHVKGIPELRKGIIKFHEYYDGVKFGPEDMVVAPGTKELILLLMMVFDGEVIVNSPAWTTYKPQALLTGRLPLLVDSREEDGWKITPARLEKALVGSSPDKRKLLILCNPCNPSGASYTEEELNSLVSTCRKHKVLILCDEIYGRLHFTGKHVCISKVYPEGGILSTGMSKWAGAGGWRMGYHIYPRELAPLRELVSSAATHSYTCAPAPMQFAFAEVLNNLPSCDEYIQHATRVMKAVSDFCYRELKSVGVRVVEPTGGFYMFPNFEVIRPALQRRGVNSGQEMCDLMLREISVALMPGGPAHLRPSEELTTRLCFVNFDGTDALAMSRSVGLQASLPDMFVKDLARPVYDGIMALKSWVSKLKTEQN